MTLTIRSKGEYSGFVKQMQRSLMKGGFLADSPENRGGAYMKPTIDAVKAFQESIGYTPRPPFQRGDADLHTQRELRTRFPPPPAPTPPRRWR